MKNHHAFARLIALLLLCALLLCGCELPTSDTDAAQATATPAVTSTEDTSDTEVTAASEPAAGLTLEWLTSDLFYTNFQCPTAVEFHADGTFTEFYIEPATMQLLDEVACTGTFELSDEKVIMLFDGKHARTLTYLSPSWQPDCQYESRYQEAMQLLDKDEFFLYEIDYVQEYDERGQPEDDAAMFYVPGYLQKISASPETDELILKIEGTWALADWAEYHFHADG
ncbi:MAG: hypothetical protein MJ085_04210 [Clostridia bacterium]|nr:hypothetical protein [Clostridia bacterium]